MNIDQTKCRKCGKDHFLQDYDAGSEREYERLCVDCFAAKIRIELSKSPLYGYRKPTIDEYGKSWCNCTQPTLTSPLDRGSAYCLRCGTPWYH